jgi:hypothetical protein
MTCSGKTWMRWIIGGTQRPSRISSAVWIYVGIGYDRRDLKAPACQNCSTGQNDCQRSNALPLPRMPGFFLLQNISQCFCTQTAKLATVGIQKCPTHCRLFYFASLSVQVVKDPHSTTAWHILGEKIHDEASAPTYQPNVHVAYQLIYYVVLGNLVHLRSKSNNIFGTLSDPWAVVIARLLSSQ